jgi:hypothetical protein
VAACRHAPRERRALGQCAESALQPVWDEPGTLHRCSGRPHRSGRHAGGRAAGRNQTACDQGNSGPTSGRGACLAQRGPPRRDGRARAAARHSRARRASCLQRQGVGWCSGEKRTGKPLLWRRPLHPEAGRKDETCPLSTGGRTRRVQLVQGEGRPSLCGPSRRYAERWSCAGRRAPPPPSRTNWTRLVPPSVLTGRTRAARDSKCVERRAPRGERRHRGVRHLRRRARNV